MLAICLYLSILNFVLVNIGSSCFIQIESTVSSEQYDANALDESTRKRIM